MYTQSHCMNISDLNDCSAGYHYAAYRKWMGEWCRPSVNCFLTSIYFSESWILEIQDEASPVGCDT